MLSVVGVMILVKGSPTGIVTAPKGTARSLRIVRHDQFIYFERRGVGFSFFFPVFIFGGRGLVVFIGGYDTILTIGTKLCCRLLLPTYSTGSEPQSDQIPRTAPIWTT